MIRFKPHRAEVRHARFSPDGRHLLTVARAPGIRASDALTGRGVWSDERWWWPGGAVYAPDGRVVECCGFRVLVRQPENGLVVRHFPATDAALALTPDGRHVLTASPPGPATNPHGGQAVGTVPFLAEYELETGRAVRSLGLGGGRVRRLAVSPDGRHAAYRGASEFGLLDLRSWRVKATVPIAPGLEHGGLVFSPDGRAVLFTAGGRLSVRDVESGEEAGAAVLDRREVRDLIFTPDGRHLLTAGRGGVTLREAGTWAAVRSFDWRIGPPSCVAVSADGSRAAAGSDYGRAVIWDLEP